MYMYIYIYRGWTIPRPGKIHEKSYGIIQGLYGLKQGLHGIVWGVAAVFVQGVSGIIFGDYMG